MTWIIQLYNEHSGMCFQINTSGTVISERPFNALSDCAEWNMGNDCIILVPGEHIVMTTVAVPKKLRKAEKQSAILYALEERLACDVDQIDFVVIRALSSELFCIAVFDSTFLARQIQFWNEAQIFPCCALPNYLALSWEPDTWSIAIQHNMALVRTHHDQGFSGEADNLLTMLQALLSEHADQKPHRIVLWSESFGVDSNLLSPLAISIADGKMQSPHCFDWFSILSKPAINLLQGKYRSKRALPVIQKAQWIMGSAVLGWVIVMTIGFYAEWMHYQRQWIPLSQQLTQMRETLFPNHVAAPTTREMRALLARYREINANQLFFKMIAAVGQVQSQDSSLVIQKLEFDRSALLLTLSTNNVTTMNAWINQLKQRQFTVSQVSENQIKISG